MTSTPSADDRQALAAGWDPDPARSMSLHAAAYVDPRWFDVEREAIFSKTWQWTCHVEKLRHPGAYVTTTVADRSIVVVRTGDDDLRAFSNVCRHRAHELLSGEGEVRRITCPYHAWSYDLDGVLVQAPHTDHLVDFEPSSICLDPVGVEEFGGFVYVNLDPSAEPLAVQAGDLADEIAHWAPDVADLTFAHRLTYQIGSDWKNVIDNFLECYHCPVAHRDFCTLVDMDTYEVTTHGIWSSHMAEAGRTANTAYSVEGATVTDHHELQHRGTLPWYHTGSIPPCKVPLALYGATFQLLEGTLVSYTPPKLFTCCQRHMHAPQPRPRRLPRPPWPSPPAFGSRPSAAPRAAPRPGPWAAPRVRSR